MPIESASIINQLNSSYPAATDGVQEGDDHIRLLKSVIKNTFPNITGAVTASHTALNQITTGAYITSAMMTSGAAVGNIGYTPLNKAGDNMTGNLTIGGAQVLHAGNYNNYSPTLTGGNASGTWGINITGRGYPRRSDGNDLNFIWSGQGGQPTYVWGGSDGTNMYVYNPSNFSVNYANSAGSAGSASTANYATSAGSANYATSAGSANSANYASSAGSASANVLKSGDTMTGNLTIQNTAPTITFADTDNITRSLHCNSNLIGFLTSGGGWAAYVDDGGNFYAVGNVSAYSDASLKTDVTTMGDGLDLIKKMRGVRYTRIDSGKREVGVIAQEVEPVLPEVVQHGDKLSVSYQNIVAPIIEAIKTLDRHVEQLADRVKALEGK